MSTKKPTPDSGVVNTSTVTDFEEAKSKKTAAASQPKEKKRASIELRYFEEMDQKSWWRIAGRVDSLGGEDEFDKTVYEWVSSGKDQASYWKRVPEAKLQANALSWLKERDPDKFTAACAKSCVETFLAGFVTQPERCVPTDYRVDAMSYLPLKGFYVGLDKNGMAWVLNPDQRFGFTHCINASLRHESIEWGESTVPHGQKCVVGRYEPKELDETSDFGRFLFKIQPDRELRERLQEALGSTLIEDNYQRAFWLYGGGSNGKSTLIDILLAFHKQSFASIKLDHFATGNQFATSQLIGKSLAIVPDAPKKPVDDATLKGLVSMDMTRYELKNGIIGSFVPKAKWILAMNNFPIVTDSSHGFWRRVEIIPFNTVLPGEADKGYIADFAKRITGNPTEMSVVLDWLLLGAMRLRQRGGFGPAPKAITELLGSWKSETDSAISFFNEYEFRPCESPVAMLEKDKVYDEYVIRCQQDGKKPFAATQFWKRFGAWWGESKFDAFEETQIRVQGGKRKRFIKGVMEDGLGLSPGSLKTYVAEEGKAEEVALPTVFSS